MPTFIAGESTEVKRLGFDDAATPPWVMVPMQGSRVVVLKDGGGLSLALRAGGARFVTIQEQAHPAGRGVLLTSIAPGTTFLDVKDASGGIRASLEVTVKQRKSLSTCFISITDSKGRGSITGINNAQRLVDVVNILYLPQANIELVHQSSRGVGLTFEMPTGMPTIFPAFPALNSWDRNTSGPLACVSSRPPGIFGKDPNTPFCILEDRLIKPMRSADDLEAIRRTQMLINVVIHVDPSADYNIFFVKALDQHAAAGGLVGFTRGMTPLKLTGAAINACFIQDSAASAQVLAHEFGHFLLSPRPSFMPPDGHSTGRNDLMTASGGPNDLRIPRAQANFMNTSGSP